MFKNKKCVRIVCLAIVLSVLPALACARATIRERMRERFLNRIKYRASASPSEITFQDIKGVLTYQDYTRSYLVHFPAQRPTKGLPLVIVLHGGGGTPENALRMSEMNPKADKEGFIVVYPAGTSLIGHRLLTWNTWICCGYALKHNVDDVGFIRALLEKLKREYPIDSKRIYVTGISNGAMLTYRLGLELSDQIAAIAPVAGALNTDTPNASEPVSVIIFHGMKDLHVLPEGGEPKEQLFNANPVENKPLSYAISYWVKRNECNPIPEREEKGNIIKETYSGGKNGTEVVVYKILDQGHAWPGGKEGVQNGNVDPPTQEISATDIMWKFFSRHSK